MGGDVVEPGRPGRVEVRAIDADLAVVELVGEFDLETRGVIAAGFLAVECPQLVVIDDTRLEFIGLDAVRELADEIERLIDRGCMLRLRVGRKVVRSLLGLVRPKLTELILRDE